MTGRSGPAWSNDRSLDHGPPSSCLTKRSPRAASRARLSASFASRARAFDEHTLGLGSRHNHDAIVISEHQIAGMD